MKKSLLLILFLLMGALVFGQTSHLYESSYYRVYSDVGPEHARETADKLDAYFAFYSKYFHFDSTQLNNNKLTFKVYKEKDDFDGYLQNVIQETRESFVFLQYSTPEKNELVGFIGDDKDVYNTYLSHYTLIQYLKSFVPNPPLWLQLGFAVYFEKATYDPNSETIVYKENLDWLNTLKSSLMGIEESDPGRQVYELTSLLTMDPMTLSQNLEKAYAQSWGLVYFLINSAEGSYNRILWDALAFLEPENTRKDNELVVINSAFGWVAKNKMLTDFASFIAQTMTFPELVHQGMSSYNLQDYDDANGYFNRAVALRKEESVPYYYLGLIEYAKAGYTKAQDYYEQALNLGGDAGLTLYAMGVNAYAAGQMTDAKFYLSNSFQLDPEGYGQRAFDLLTRIEELESSSESDS